MNMTWLEKKYLPNILTISRIVLTFIFIIFIFLKGIRPRIIGLILFSLASITDMYDGRIARKYNLVSDFGKLMDPIADKILVLGAFLTFVQLQLIPAWMVIVIILRESFITGFRLVALRQGKVLAAMDAGKYKTVSQMATIFIILIFLIFKEVMLARSLWSADMEFYSFAGITILMSITLALTIISGLSFVLRNKHLLKI